MAGTTNSAMNARKLANEWQSIRATFAFGANYLPERTGQVCAVPASTRGIALLRN
jgi:hypothetical protein